MVKVYDVKSEWAVKALLGENKMMSLPQAMNDQAPLIKPTISFVKMELTLDAGIDDRGLLEKKNRAGRNQNQPIVLDLNNLIVAKSNYKMNGDNDEILCSVRP